LGRAVRNTVENAALAVCHPGSTDSRLPRVAALVATRVPFVDLIVAVVVKAIAHLCAGLHVLLTLEGTTHTRVGTRSTHTGLACVTGGSHTLGVLIHCAIAVVVEVVAELRGRRHVLYTLDGTHHTMLRTRSAYSQEARVAGSTTSGIAVVYRAIAVIVEAIALLR
jgi:hypothetical protein